MQTKSLPTHIVQTRAGPQAGQYQCKLQKVKTRTKMLTIKHIAINIFQSSLFIGHIVKQYSRQERSIFT